jgi:hypothetical protein
MDTAVAHALRSGRAQCAPWPPTPRCSLSLPSSAGRGRLARPHGPSPSLSRLSPSLPTAGTRARSPWPPELPLPPPRSRCASTFPSSRPSSGPHVCTTGSTPLLPPLRTSFCLLVAGAPLPPAVAAGQPPATVAWPPRAAAGRARARRGCGRPPPCPRGRAAGPRRRRAAPRNGVGPAEAVLCSVQREEEEEGPRCDNKTFPGFLS